MAKILVATISLVIALGLVEGMVRGLGLFKAGRQASAMTPEARAAATDRGTKALTKRVLHPYLGWVHRPFDGKHNAFGMPSRIRDYRTLPTDDYVIGVTGGSFALGVAKHAGQAIVDSIEEQRPDLAGRVQVIPLALGGYKQPQQLFLVAETLLLDVPIDAVVNIDGFNEIALGCNDAKRGYFPFFPTRNYWAQTIGFASGDLTRDEILSTAKALQFRQKAAAIRRWLAGSAVLSRLQLIRSAAGIVILRAEAAAVAAEESIESSSRKHLPSVVRSLQRPSIKETENCAELVADIWRESSVLLNALCRTADIPYLHFLQPNQYVAESKPLTREEKAIAYRPERQWSRAISEGYSALIVQGPTLDQEGVEFHDLTMIFDQDNETRYVDDCCHLNPIGYQIIGRKIADRLLVWIPDPV